jgi:hypothetical protein
LQNQSEALINEGLQTRRQSTSLLGQETAIERQELRDIYHRVSGESHCPCGQQDVSWGVGQFKIAGDHGNNCGLNPAEIEGVRLDHKHRAPVSGLGAARFGQIRPPNLSAMNPAHVYQASF